MSFYFGEETWLELGEAIKKDTLIIIPVGTTEEHGRHLPKVIFMVASGKLL